MLKRAARFARRLFRGVLYSAGSTGTDATDYTIAERLLFTIPEIPFIAALFRARADSAVGKADARRSDRGESADSD